MRSGAGPAVAVAFLLASAGAGADELPYVPQGTPLEWAAVLAPAPSHQVGLRTLQALARARGLPLPTAPAADPDAPTWRPAARGPFGAASERPAPTTVVDDEGGRVAALHLRTTFRAGPEAARLRVLRLRVRYRDALVAWVNDVEVARRNLPVDVAPDAYASRSRGPEWETFYIDLVGRPGLVRPGDNVLRLEVRPGVRREIPLAEMELFGAERARVVRGPLIQRVGVDDALIVFETDTPTTAQVLVGLEAGRTERAVRSPAGRSNRHVVHLADLPRDAMIRYRVATPDGVSEEHAFHTAPDAGEVVRFAVYGDVRSGHAVHEEILDAVTAEAPDFVVTTGDMVLRGSDAADWQRFFALAGPTLARVPVYPAAGNHDLGHSGDEARGLEDLFELPAADRPEGAHWYAFDVGDVHVAVLDSNRWDDAAQRTWLDHDLAAARARGARAIFAACHHGPWSRGPHGGDATAAREIAPILERHGALVIFSGHDHLYQRGQVGQLRYVVSGGGGAALYRARCGGRRCARDGAITVASEHHYVMVEVYRDHAELCARRPDRTALEPCVTLPLPAR